MVLRQKHVAFLDVTFRATQNEISIFIFFYKTPWNETVVLCRRIARRNLTLDLNVPSGSDISVELYTKDNSYYTQDTYSLNNCLAGIAISDNYSSIECNAHYFIGWYDAQEGGNLVKYAKSDMTVYAYYHEFPYKYWIDDADVTHLSFAFNPEDFDLPTDRDYVVIHACELSGWDKSTVKMTKDVNGIYRCEYTSERYAISTMWPSYKFIVDERWLGSYDGYKYKSYLKAGETYENKPNYDFLIKELMGNYK